MEEQILAACRRYPEVRLCEGVRCGSGCHKIPGLTLHRHVPRTEKHALYMLSAGRL